MRRMGSVMVHVHRSRKKVPAGRALFFPQGYVRLEIRYTLGGKYAVKSRLKGYLHLSAYLPPNMYLIFHLAYASQRAR